MHIQSDSGLELVSCFCFIFFLNQTFKRCYLRVTRVDKMIIVLRTQILFRCYPCLYLISIRCKQKIHKSQVQFSFYNCSFAARTFRAFHTGHYSALNSLNYYYLHFTVLRFVDWKNKNSSTPLVHVSNGFIFMQEILYSLRFFVRIIIISTYVKPSVQSTSAAINRNNDRVFKYNASELEFGYGIQSTYYIVYRVQISHGFGKHPIAKYLILSSTRLMPYRPRAIQSKIFRGTHTIMQYASIYQLFIILNII